MARSPSFLFYSEAFLSGAACLSFEDRGKYITILCFMHQAGKINEEGINGLVGDISEALRAKFTVDEKGHWHNKRLEHETQRRERYIRSRRVNGCYGGRPVKERPEVELHSLQESNTEQRTKSIALPVEEKSLEVVFQKWVEYRKHIHKPLKAESIEGAFKRLKELSSNDVTKAETIISFSIDNGYQGLFPLKEDKYKQFKTTTEQWLA